MSTSKFSLKTLLAEASYGRFASELPNRTEIESALLAEDLSSSQIADLNAKYAILSHRQNTDRGFSATLFQEKGSVGNTGLTLAIRGTEPGFLGLGVDVVSADLGGIVLEGAALYQIVDLYNYWQQLTAPATAIGRLARLVETDDPTASGIFTQPMPVGIGAAARVVYRRIEFFDQANAGLGIVTGPISNITVTGHSLGGHLATAFQRLFPAVVGEVFTVNGAGTRGSEILNKFFNTLTGQSNSAFDPTLVSNLYGSAGPNVISGELVYAQIGSRGEIYTESIMDVGGHGYLRKSHHGRHSWTISSPNWCPLQHLELVPLPKLRNSKHIPVAHA